MKQFLNRSKSLLRLTAVALWVIIPSYSFAAPGTLSQLPLVGSTGAPANLMILLGASMSMRRMTEYTPYDDAVNYGACPSATGAVTLETKLAGLSGGFNSTQLYAITTVSGSPLNATVSYTNTAGTAKTVNFPLTSFGFGSGQICFNPATTNRAAIGKGIQSATLVNTPGSSGNYLNWYFAIRPEGTAWTAGSGAEGYYKPSATTRSEAAIALIRNMLINDLTGVNAGLGIYSGTNGVTILMAPTNVDTARSASPNPFSTVVFPAEQTWAPASPAAAQIGRYFMNGYTGNVVIHPGQSNQASVLGTSVFNAMPAAFASGVSSASPLTAAQWCQKNILLMVADGQDNAGSISSYLSNYLNGTDKDLDDVASALSEINLRPDILDNQGNPVLHNFITNTITMPSGDATALQAMADAGDGVSYNVADGNELAIAMKRMAINILSQIASASGIAFNSTGFQTGTALYSASYNTGQGTGDLKKLAISTTGVITYSPPVWSFQSILQLTTPSARFMFTNTGVKTAALFTSTNLTGLSAQQQADLNQGPTAADGQGAARIDYIRGSSATSSFRVRTSILGDIVNSSPTYVGPPVAGLYPSDAAYTAFASANANRAPMIYVGDNSGVLHAINASTGAEAFGFLPLNLFSNAALQGYHYLTDPQYVHRFYINGPNTVADSYVGTAWRTMLVSSEGAGGKGVFALDVTNPSSFTSGNQSSIFKWEFSSASDPDLGYTFGEPIIAKMNNGKWYAIFGNGYNSTNGVAKLFIVSLAGPSGASWVNGTDYYELSTASGSTTTPDGLSSPTAVDLDGNGTIDRIYAGSVLGKMWSFDVSSATATSWGSVSQLINVGQPITGAPLVTAHPTITASGNGANRMVYFGTGQYVTQADNSDTSARGLYAVWDNAAGTATTSQLVTQTLTTSGAQRTVSANPVDYTTKRGWMIALSGGERSITQPQLVNTTVFFGTMLPQPMAVAPCTVNNGMGWLIGVNQKDGSSGNQIFDTNGDNVVNSSDKSGANIVVGMAFTSAYPNDFSFLGDSVYAPLSDGTISKIVVSFANPIPAYHGRISVQEITGESK